MSEVFNPLNKLNIGESVADALLKKQAQPITEIESFSGAGIYAIYYGGEFKAYRPISVKLSGDTSTIPIYVGKAIPAGARRGASLEVSAVGNSLWKRIKDHKDSLSAVSNSESGIVASDFLVRFLTVDDVWIPLGEALLISKFDPVWNACLDGFGNHDPGKGRYNGLRPKWDVVHPGRAWADKCRPRTESRNELLVEIANHFGSKLI